MSDRKVILYTDNGDYKSIIEDATANTFVKLRLRLPKNAAAIIECAESEELTLRPRKVDSARLIRELKTACMAYQHISCDTNFFAMLMGIKAAALSGVAIGTKAVACITWLDGLWADEDQRETDDPTNRDFSIHGRCPHTFTAVRAEAEGGV